MKSSCWKIFVTTTAITQKQHFLHIIQNVTRTRRHPHQSQRKSTLKIAFHASHLVRRTIAKTVVFAFGWKMPFSLSVYLSCKCILKWSFDMVAKTHSEYYCLKASLDHFQILYYSKRQKQKETRTRKNTLWHMHFSG